MNSLLFVYGTLKSDRGNHRVLKPLAKFVGNGFIIGEISRPNGIDLDLSKKGIVNGELYEVTHPKGFNRLDSFEGVPYGYNRKKTKVYLNDDTIQEAFVYEYNRRF